MRIFISYGSEDRRSAEEIALALRGEGNTVFLDTMDLSPGAGYNAVIRQRISKCDRAIFLISPESVTPGRYTLSELTLIEEKWPHPGGRVLPVMLRSTRLDAIPAYLRSVTILEPTGNVSAEVAARLYRRRRVPWWVAVLLIMVLAATLTWRLARGSVPIDQAARWVVQVTATLDDAQAPIPLTASGVILVASEDSFYVVTTSRVVQQEGRRSRSVRVTSQHLGLSGVPARIRNVDPQVRLAVLALARPSRAVEGPAEAVATGSSLRLKAGDAVLPLVCRWGSCGDRPPEPGRVTAVDSESVRFASSWVELGAAGGGLYNSRHRFVAMITSQTEALRVEQINGILKSWGLER